MTRQLVLLPHDPGHGSTHLRLIHALSSEHSEFVVHSGRQVGGTPTYPDKQEQTACSLTSRHCELAPQGDGWHLLTYSLIIANFKKLK